MKYSVIDISSSSISLIIAEADERKTEIIFKDRISVSLLHYLDGKTLTERGTEKLIDALKTMKDECERFGVRYCYLISTAALRVIANCDEVSRIVAEKTGLAVNFLDGKTEAFCDYVANLYYASYEKAVLIDLGGKSLEICDLTKGSKDDMVCLDFGLLDIHRKFVKKIQPNEKEAKDIKKFVSDKFDDAKIPKKEVFATAVMVGATNHAVYDIYADYENLKTEDGVKRIEYKKFKKLVGHLLGDAERSTLILNNAPEKLYLIGPAAIILKTIFKRFDLKSIVVSDRGVKEGYLQLVWEGKEAGQYYDLQEKKVGGVPRESIESASISKVQPEKTKKSDKNTGKEKSEDISEKKKERAEKPQKPEKTDSQKKPEGVAATVPAKKRGRPPKKQAESEPDNKD